MTNADTDPIDPPAVVAALRETLEAVAVDGDAPAMVAYMKDQFPFLGIKAAARRAAQRPTLAALSGTTGDQLLDVAERCWAEPERELQYVATDALRKHVATLDAAHLDRVAALITTKPWWDTVDMLAIHTVGPMVARHPDLTPVMDAWIDDELWLARTAILHQLSYKEATNAERLFAYAERRAGDTEFFIRKALGWALRQHARVDPEAVRAFVATHDAELSGLTKREALKHLS